MESDSDSDSYAGSAESIAQIEDQSETKIATQVESAFDPLPLDKAVAVEARNSGLLNAHKIELEEVMEKVKLIQSEHPALQAKFDQLLNSTKQNLKWLDEQLSSLEIKMKAQCPIEFAQAEEKFNG